MLLFFFSHNFLFLLIYFITVCLYMLIHLWEGPPITFPSGFGSGTQVAFLNHPALSPINRCDPHENFREICSSFTPEQAVSSKKRGFCSCLYLQPLALSLALSLLVAERMSGYFFTHLPPTATSSVKADKGCNWLPGAQPWC